MDKGNCVIKLMLEPDTKSADTLDGQSRTCNWLYNTLVDKAQHLRKQFVQTGKSEIAKIVYTERGLRDLLPTLKKEKPFLNVVHSSPLKNTAIRLSRAVQSHQKSKKGKRKGKRVGWPKFRSWQRNWCSLFYDEPNKGFKIEGNNLIISLGMGKDRQRRSLKIPMKDVHILKGKTIRNLRIVKQLGVFYAVFTVHKKLPSTKAVDRLIALDPNHKNLAYGVDTKGQAIEITAPTWLKNYDKRIDELKRKRDRCDKKSHKLPVLDENNNPTGKEYYQPSKRWKKYDRVLKRCLQKRQDQTKMFLFTTAHQLMKQYDCVAIGNYTPHGEGITTKMRRAMNNRSLIGRFKEVLCWVAQKSGKTFIEYDEKGTTRTCNNCQTAVIGGISPSIRRWECGHCQTEHHRDENAAKNGLKKALSDLKTKSETLFSQVSGSDLVQIVERWAWRVLPSGVLCIPQGQDCDNFTTSGN